MALTLEKFNVEFAKFLMKLYPNLPTPDDKNFREIFRHDLYVNGPFGEKN